jgi:hypothetical protein
VEPWTSWMFIPWLRSGGEEGMCARLVCENQDFFVFACLFFLWLQSEWLILLLDWTCELRQCSYHGFGKP